MTRVEYKYIRKLDGTINWSADPNNVVLTVINGTQIVDDVFRVAKSVEAGTEVAETETEAVETETEAVETETEAAETEQ